MTRFKIFPELREFLEQVTDDISQVGLSKKTGISTQKIHNFLKGKVKSIDLTDWLSLHRFLAKYIQKKPLPNPLYTKFKASNNIGSLLYPTNNLLFRNVMIKCAEECKKPSKKNYFYHVKNCPIKVEFDIDSLTAGAPDGSEPMLPPINVFLEAKKVVKSLEKEITEETVIRNKLIFLGYIILNQYNKNNPEKAELTSDILTEDRFNDVIKKFEHFTKEISLDPNFVRGWKYFDLEDIIKVVIDGRTFKESKEKIQEAIKKMYHKYMKRVDGLAQVLCELMPVDEVCCLPPKSSVINSNIWKTCKYKLSPYILLTRSVANVLPKVISEHNPYPNRSQLIESNTSIFKSFESEISKVINKYEFQTKIITSNSIQDALSRFIKKEFTNTLESFIKTKNANEAKEKKVKDEEERLIYIFAVHLWQEVERIKFACLAEGELPKPRGVLKRNYKLPIEKFKFKIERFTSDSLLSKNEILKYVKETIDSDPFINT